MAIPGCLRHMMRSGWCFAMVACCYTAAWLHTTAPAPALTMRARASAAAGAEDGDAPLVEQRSGAATRAAGCGACDLLKERRSSAKGTLCPSTRGAAISGWAIASVLIHSRGAQRRSEEEPKSAYLRLPSHIGSPAEASLQRWAPVPRMRAPRPRFLPESPRTTLLPTSRPWTRSHARSTTRPSATTPWGLP